MITRVLSLALLPGVRMARVAARCTAWTQIGRGRRRLRRWTGAGAAPGYERVRGDCGEPGDRRRLRRWTGAGAAPGYERVRGDCGEPGDRRRVHQRRVVQANACGGDAGDQGREAEREVVDAVDGPDQPGPVRG